MIESSSPSGKSLAAHVFVVRFSYQFRTRFFDILNFSARRTPFFCARIFSRFRVEIKSTIEKRFSASASDLRRRKRRKITRRTSRIESQTSTEIQAALKAKSWLSFMTSSGLKCIKLRKKIIRTERKTWASRKNSLVRWKTCEEFLFVSLLKKKCTAKVVFSILRRMEHKFVDLCIFVVTDSERNRSKFDPS